jgi:hypothetical protein
MPIESGLVGRRGPGIGHVEALLQRVVGAVAARRECQALGVVQAQARQVAVRDDRARTVHLVEPLLGGRQHLKVAAAGIEGEAAQGARHRQRQGGDRGAAQPSVGSGLDHHDPRAGGVEEVQAPGHRIHRQALGVADPVVPRGENAAAAGRRHAVAAGRNLDESLRARVVGDQTVGLVVEGQVDGVGQAQAEPARSGRPVAADQRHAGHRRPRTAIRHQQGVGPP